MNLRNPIRNIKYFLYFVFIFVYYKPFTLTVLWRSGIQPNTALQSLTTSFDIAVGLIATFLDKLG